MFPYCKYTEKDIKSYLESATLSDAERSLTTPSPTFTDFLNFISPVAADLIPAMRKKAAMIKRMHFGKTVRVYSPLYVSNFCINDCLYCGFRTSYCDHQRRRLTKTEVMQEASIIKGYGIDSLLLVSGEDPKGASVDYFVDIVHELKKMFSYIAIEIYPMSQVDYKRLFDAGVHGLTIYQETYDRETYEKLHLKGPKSNYSARLDAVVAGGNAGFYNIGLGALLGLYDWRSEAVSLAAHGLWIRKKFWRSKIQFSFPRITPVEGGFDPLAPVSEPELEQMMLAFRLFFHEADLYISTRESHQFRALAAKNCASHVSAASQVVPGGYYDEEQRKQDLGQFTVNDSCSVEQVSDDLVHEGLEVIFKDWDPCLGS
jgi:2-iminoacetate synthase